MWDAMTSAMGAKLSLKARGASDLYADNAVAQFITEAFLIWAQRRAIRDSIEFFLHARDSSLNRCANLLKARPNRIADELASPHK